MTPDHELFTLNVPAALVTPANAADRAALRRQQDADFAAFRRQWYPNTTRAEWAAWHAGTGARPQLVRPERPAPAARVHDGVLVEHFDDYNRISTTLYGKTTVVVRLLSADAAAEAKEKVA